MNRITSILFFAVTVLGACGASATGPGANAPATTSRPAATLPDLNDPAVRQRFVCSFAPGSFGISPQASSTVDPYCENANETNP